MSTITLKQAKANLADVCDEVVMQREPVVVKRGRREAVAIVPMDELAGLLETAHLLRSPANARRLQAALRRARDGKVEELTLDQVRQKVGLHATRG